MSLQLGPDWAQALEEIAARFHIRPAELTPDARLVEDLGLDGLDAIQFFAAVEDRFGTDLTALHQAWSRHFNPEGMPPLAMLGALAVLILCGLLTSALAVPELHPYALGGLVLLGLALWLLRRRQRRLYPPLPPLTLADVTAAIEAGAWPPGDRPGEGR